MKILLLISITFCLNRFSFVKFTLNSLTDSIPFFLILNWRKWSLISLIRLIHCTSIIVFFIKFINLHVYQFSSHHIEIKGFSTIITCCVCVLKGESEPPTSISQIKYFLHFPLSTYHLLFFLYLLFINNHLRQLIHTFNILFHHCSEEKGGD